jgi:FkbM family methyltransferase
MKFIHLIRDFWFSVITVFWGDKDSLVLCSPWSGPLSKLKYKLNLRSGNEAGYYYGNYDQNIFFILKDFIRNDWVVWEYGCFVGYYSVFFSTKVGSTRFVALEGNCENYKRVCANVELNGNLAKYVVNAVVSDLDGFVDFEIDPNTNSRLVRDFVYVGEDSSRFKDPKNIVKTKSFTPDGMLTDFPKPDFIKIDIEGAEFVVLDSMHKIATEIRPFILLELHNPLCDKKASTFCVKYNYMPFLFGKKRLEKIEISDICETILLIPVEKKHELARISQRVQ